MDIELWKSRKKELNLTFDELSELSGVSRRQLLYIFNGQAKNIGIDTAQRITCALGLDEKEKSPPTELSEGEERWMQLYYALTDDNKELLIKLIATFKDMPADRRRFVLDAIKMATHK